MANKLKSSRIATVPQSKMSAECWLVQMWGTDECAKCEYADTEDCGGPNIRATGRNEKGFQVPIR